MAESIWSCARQSLETPASGMGLLPDMYNCGLRMRLECRERFPRHRLQRKPLVSDTGMHNGTCVTQVPWCMSGMITRGGGENVPDIPGAGTTRNFIYLIRGPGTYITGHASDSTVATISWKIPPRSIYQYVYDISSSWFYPGKLNPMPFSLVLPRIICFELEIHVS